MEPNPIRQQELTQAAANPNIISKLAGAPSTAAPTPQPQPQQPPQSPPPGLTASSMQQTAQDFSNKLYGGSNFVGGGEAQKESMMREMFAYDQKLEQGQSPYPQTSWYVQNPADLMATGNQYAGQAAQNIGTTIGAVDTTERAYANATQAVMSQFMDLLKLQEDRKNRELELEYQKQKDAEDKRRWEAEFGLKSKDAGSTTNELAELSRILGGTPNTQSGETDIIKQIIGGDTAGQSAQIKNTDNQPTYSGIYTVREKATGRMGSLPSTEYDPSKYEFIK